MTARRATVCASVLATLAGAALLLASAVTIGTPSVAATSALAPAPAASTAQAAAPSAAAARSAARARLRPGDEMTVEEFGEPEALPLPPLAKQRAAITGASITIPALGAALPIRRAPPKGGQMAVPGGVRSAGWLTTSSAPGEAGVAVLATHRDTGRGGRGIRSPLYGLEALRRGASIEVIGLDGKTTTYAVTRVDHYPRNALPPALMQHFGAARLALVSCGGPLVMGQDDRLRWSQRVVVWAAAV